MFPRFEFFRKVFLQITDNFGCMVIVNRGAVKDILDKVFFYKAKIENIEGNDIINKVEKKNYIKKIKIENNDIFENYVNNNENEKEIAVELCNENEDDNVKEKEKNNDIDTETDKLFDYFANKEKIHNININIDKEYLETNFNSQPQNNNQNLDNESSQNKNTTTNTFEHKGIIFNLTFNIYTSK